MDIIANTETDQFPQIRSLVSLSFEEDDIPDSLISSDSFLGDANLKIKELLPNWDVYMDGGDNEKRLKSLVRKTTAAQLLSPSERNEQYTVDDLTFSKDLINAIDLAEQYRKEVLEGVNYFKNISDGSGSSSGSRNVVGVVV